jgi:hypothetical protein
MQWICSVARTAIARSDDNVSIRPRCEHRGNHIPPPAAIVAKCFNPPPVRLLECGGPVKRSQALRGRNLARNSRIDGAPKRTPPWATSSFRGRFVSHPSDTGAMPPKILRAKPSHRVTRSGYLRKRQAGPPRRAARLFSRFGLFADWLIQPFDERHAAGQGNSAFTSSSSQLSRVGGGVAS